MDLIFRLFGKEKEVRNEEQIQEKGRRATALINSVSYQECMEDLEEGIWQQFFDTDADDVQAREVLYTHINALRYIDNKLKQSSQDGQVSEALEKMNNA